MVGNIGIARIATALTAPGPIGATTAGSGAFTTLTASSGAFTTLSATASLTLGGSSSIAVLVGGTNLLEQRNGGSAQIFRQYETYTSGINFARLSLVTQAENYLIRSEAGGTGSLRTLQIGSGPKTGTNLAGADTILHAGQGTGSAAGGAIHFQVAPGGSGSRPNTLVTAWQIGSTGHLVAGDTGKLIKWGAYPNSGAAIKCSTNELQIRQPDDSGVVPLIYKTGRRGQNRELCGRGKRQQPLSDQCRRDGRGRVFPARSQRLPGGRSFLFFGRSGAIVQRHLRHRDHSHRRHDHGAWGQIQYFHARPCPASGGDERQMGGSQPRGRMDRFAAMSIFAGMRSSRPAHNPEPQSL